MKKNKKNNIVKVINLFIPFLILYISINMYFLSNASANTLMGVYRLYNPNNGDHFYTISENEKNSAINGGYKLEDVQQPYFYAYTTQVSGTVPVYRLYKPNNGDHFYTISENEKNSAINGGYRLENDSQPYFYAYTTQVSGTVPVYRLFNGVDHFYTISEEENSISNNYTREGIAFYVYQSLPNNRVYSTQSIASQGIASPANVRYTISTYVFPTNGGTISPTSMQVNAGESARFGVVPNPGYRVSSIKGCNGNFPDIYETGPIYSDCTISVVFLPLNVASTLPSVNGQCGSANGQTFTSAPTTNLCSAGTPSTNNPSFNTTTNRYEWICNGQNGGNPASCSANIQTYTVSTSAGAGGSISPTSKTVNHGSTTTFTITPNNGYITSNINFICGNTQQLLSVNSSNTYTIGPITTNCTVNATFSELIITPIKSSTQPTKAACETFCSGWKFNNNNNISVIAYQGNYFVNKEYNCGCYNALDKNTLVSLGNSIQNVIDIRSSSYTAGSIRSCERCSNAYNNEKVTFNTYDPICDSFTNPVLSSNTTYIEDTSCGGSKIYGDRPKCGTASGQTFISAPTTNLCSAGIPSNVLGTGPWTWTCAGSNGGNPASCSANKLLSPTSGTHTGSTTQITWKWNSVTGASRYEWSTNGSSWTNKDTLTSHTESGLSGGTSYTRYVRACNQYGCSNNTNLIFITAPNQPTSGTHTGSTTQITWKWNSVTGATIYELYSGSTTTPMQIRLYSGANKFHTEPNLSPGTSYTRYVRACNQYGCSNNTNLIFITAPTASTHTATQNSITWNWNLINVSTNINIRYEIYSSSTITANTLVYSGTGISHTEPNLQPNTQYTRYIRACTNIGCTSIVSMSAKTLNILTCKLGTGVILGQWKGTDGQIVNISNGSIKYNYNIVYSFSFVDTSVAGTTTCNLNVLNNGSNISYKFIQNEPDKICDVNNPTVCFVRQCPAGRYYSGSDIISNYCRLADVGYYVANTGSTMQTPCSPGTYQNQTGQVACKKADTGYYVSSTGASVQILCESGKYQDKTGQSSCKDVPAEYYATDYIDSTNYKGARSISKCNNGLISSTGATSAGNCYAPQCILPDGSSIDNGQEIELFKNNAPVGIGEGDFCRMNNNNIKVYCLYGNLKIGNNIINITDPVYSIYTYKGCDSDQNRILDCVDSSGNVILENGGTQNIDMYMRSEVEYYDDCSNYKQTQTRQCINGFLSPWYYGSGSTGNLYYTFTTCTKRDPSNCSVNTHTGIIVLSHGNRLNLYNTNKTSFPNECDPISVICDNGVLKRTNGDGGIFINNQQYYLSCINGEPSDCDVIDDNGVHKVIKHGGKLSRIRYKSELVEYDGKCESENQEATCNNGSIKWSGIYTATKCEVKNPLDCIDPNNETIKHNESNIYYQNETVSHNSQCVSQTRSCVNGTLSGEFIFKTCDKIISQCNAGEYVDSINNKCINCEPGYYCPDGKDKIKIKDGFVSDTNGGVGATSITQCKAIYDCKDGKRNVNISALNTVSNTISNAIKIINNFNINNNLLVSFKNDVSNLVSSINSLIDPSITTRLMASIVGDQINPDEIIDDTEKIVNEYDELRLKEEMSDVQKVLDKKDVVLNLNKLYNDYQNKIIDTKNMISSVQSIIDDDRFILNMSDKYSENIKDILSIGGFDINIFSEYLPSISLILSNIKSNLNTKLYQLDSNYVYTGSYISNETKKILADKNIEDALSINYMKSYVDILNNKLSSEKNNVRELEIQIKTLEKEKGDTENKLNEKRIESASLLSQLNTLSGSITDAKDDIENKNKILHAKFGEMILQFENLKKISSNINNMSISDMYNTISGTGIEIDDIKKIDRLVFAISPKNNMSFIDIYNNILNQISNTNTQIDKLQKEKDKIVTIRDTIQNNKVNMDKYKGDLENVSKYRAEIQNIKNNMKDIQNKINDIQNKIMEYKAELSKYDKTVASALDNEKVKFVFEKVHQDKVVKLAQYNSLYMAFVSSGGNLATINDVDNIQSLLTGSIADSLSVLENIVIQQTGSNIFKKRLIPLTMEIIPNNDFVYLNVNDDAHQKYIRYLAQSNVLKKYKGNILVDKNGNVKNIDGNPIKIARYLVDKNYKSNMLTAFATMDMLGRIFVSYKGDIPKSSSGFTIKLTMSGGYIATANVDNTLLKSRINRISGWKIMLGDINNDNIVSNFDLLNTVSLLNYGKTIDINNDMDTNFEDVVSLIKSSGKLDVITSALPVDNFIFNENIVTELDIGQKDDDDVVVENIDLDALNKNRYNSNNIINNNVDVDINTGDTVQDNDINDNYINENENDNRINDQYLSGSDVSSNIE